ncbi:pseudouridine-5'-phosphate glycosidase [Acetoanaerobium noterae]|uniref:Pseudouridine-5'-phosphate glycosidase n=1 Tax=Acetoanaerobium noterae TaxID=745369 RepID=A0A1T5A4U0_9FIRM|nr:pseudouridine-5'-phosphate glycosidase [Acetoanaerobium noterae]SKB29849.1 pseudouridine-5'-phosphate glycosidase [Acetoanaerobium noterae]
MKNYLELSPEVEKAIVEKRPVVALESTIISHGMPYPQNLETALKVEEIVRSYGAVPATIGIIKGKLKAGLTREELEYFATAKDIVKASRRDLPYITANKMNGATTVASTMIIAHMAGIKVFVTGGIGGVHRGATDTFDISADLMELAQTPVAVICAGAKSILDIGLTLEYLETQGVPVLGYQTEDFPAFYTRESGYKADYSIENPQLMAKVIADKWNMKLKGGVVIGNPIPKEHELEPAFINKSIEEALEKAEAGGIKGKKVTPFLLDYLKSATKGDSLAANIELVYNNARVGSQIAVELAKLD